MATPSEVPLMKQCHRCQVVKPLSEFLTFVTGARAGRIASDCTRCWISTSQYAGDRRPTICRACGTLRPRSDFDRNAEKGKICKLCLLANSVYLKTCTTCGVAKPLTEFHNRSKSVYKDSVCKKCAIQACMAKHRRRAPEATARARKHHNDSLKEQAYAGYGGAICACCGETCLSFLTLDHINNDGAAWRREHFKTNKGRGGISTYEWCKRNGYPPIFQVLCWNCQQGKRFNHGICPHQTKTCNDYPMTGVESSDSKRFGSVAAAAASGS